MGVTIKLERGHIYFFLMFLNTFIYTIFKRKYYHIEGITHSLFHSYILTISDLCCIFLYLIKKIKSRNINKKKEVHKKGKNELNLIYYKFSINKIKLFKRSFIVSISDLLISFSFFFYYLYIEIYNRKEIYRKIYFLLIINLLSKYLFSRIFLKTYFYKHHYLSFAINAICLVFLGIFDIINFWDRDYDKTNIIFYIFVLLYRTILYSFEDVIGKKALNEEFLSPYSLILIKGIFKTIMMIFITIPFFFISINGKNILFDIRNIFNGYIDILKYGFYIVLNLSYNVLIWIIIDKYSPSHLGMANVLEMNVPLLYLLFFEVNKINYLFILELLINIILIIGALIHNEIIIISFCGFDQYTKERYKEKSKEDFIQCALEDDNDSFDNDDEEEEKNNNIQIEINDKNLFNNS